MNDHYSMLGVGRQASTAEIANAYRQLLIRERQEKGDKADFGAYSLAYRTLTNHGKRLEYDRFLDELSGKYLIKDPESPSEAEKCYLAGLTCMEQKNFQDAVDYLYRAVQLEPEQSHFCSQLGLALGMFKDRLAEAERYCKKAISIDPDNPDFRFNLGFLYQRHNLVDAAQTAFDLANEAITARQARMLRENEPLITPWEQEGQDLLDELTRLETMVNGAESALDAESAATGRESTAPPEVKGPDSTPAYQPTASPGAPEELVTESDLLRQLDDLESQVSKAELAEALAATAEQAEAPMEPFLNDDLLKELDLLEAQVRGVEEYHNGEHAKAGLESAEEPPSQAQGPDHSEVGEEKPPEAAAAPAETEAGAVSEVERFRDFLGPEPAQASASTTEETFHEMSLEEETPPAPAPERVEDPARLEAPEVAEMAAEPDLAKTEAEPATEAPQAAAAEAFIPEEPAAALAEPEPALARTVEAADAAAPAQEQHLPDDAAKAAERSLPRGPAVEKLRMLEELEKETLGELELIRREKEKLQAAL